MPASPDEKPSIDETQGMTRGQLGLEDETTKPVDTTGRTEEFKLDAANSLLNNPDPKAQARGGTILKEVAAKHNKETGKGETQ